MQTKLDHCFATHPEGLTIPAVKDLVKEVSSHSLVDKQTGALQEVLARPVDENAVS